MEVFGKEKNVSGVFFGALHDFLVIFRILDGFGGFWEVFWVFETYKNTHTVRTRKTVRTRACSYLGGGG